EAYFQEHILHNPVESVGIPIQDNMQVIYTAGLMQNAPHPQAARAFLQFLTEPAAQAIYRHYGFMAPDSRLLAH
ncbi:MAG: extracellular solute-binding protein, partial [Gammaproteobacteria bacterium]|nr:extracellular solute-binding protein [Gammaproteobacteria bacterium]